MGKNYVFSSESVGEGHPDKVSDTISDAVLDACLLQDKHSRVACETFVKSNIVCVGGEITTKSKFDVEEVVRDAIREIGYVNDDDVFHADHVFINNYLTAQSPAAGRVTICSHSLKLAQKLAALRHHPNRRPEVLGL